jgi:hypothetical protein
MVNESSHSFVSVSGRGGGDVRKIRVRTIEVYCTSITHNYVTNKPNSLPGPFRRNSYSIVQDSLVGMGPEDPLTQMRNSVVAPYLRGLLTSASKLITSISILEV